LKINRLLAGTLALVLIGGIASPNAFSHGNVDQEQLVGFNGSSLLFLSPVGQEFVPTQNNIIGVDLWFFNSQGDADVTVEIRDSIGGALLTSVNQIVPNTNNLDVHFDFPSAVSLASCSPSCVILVTSSDPILINSWGNSLSSDLYPQGMAIISGVLEPNHDLKFRTYYQEDVVGGELLSIDSTALLMAAASSPSAWLSSLALVALGIGAYVFTRNPSNMRNIKVILRDYLDRF